ncbi:ankyrin repeat protein, putative [Trichomonas vaginalis G3]|uniref:Ankyrin repeat protein, putative n=1 Tax=Trichomonas vaginalis (strain ATCC PRA-98 / G3) TaxID=412133 RepID=A2D948_TRIV3|nr:cyclin-dependent kinase inhibitor 2C-related family [Trichomonas vaginalis G3]EAY23074.1 ankyrin repeat protein, putative [Trichomonas vaginalis G3]KAI5519042.1 cyclin-dependent kinase inhibitor 2C-related family [Trichomonas vaginalis G3]|eukprot:XP_001584060.1 ankyrin repeat protein [Trichomonas vaginalis G3]
MIKMELIDSKKYRPQYLIKNIFDIIPYNNRYTKSNLKLAKLITDDYHVLTVPGINDLSKYLFYEEYGINLGNTKNFDTNTLQNLKIHSEDTIFRAIMYNDIERFITFTEREGFDKDQKLKSSLYPNFHHIVYSLLELCCYHGAVDCFKLLRTKFNSEITYDCLKFSFLGGKQEIMSECLKYQKPYWTMMEYAIISHNIDFVTFLMNEYGIKINLKDCGKHKNLESFLVYFDQTNNIDESFVGSTMFDILSFCKYFLTLGANINAKYSTGQTALHIASENNSKEIAELLLSHGANVNEKNEYGQTALHKAAEHNSKEVVELLLSHGANVNEKNTFGQIALHKAAENNSKEIAELLLSHGANVNEKNIHGQTALHKAAKNNSKEVVELLLSHGANINEKDKYKKTALHIAAYKNSKEIVELLLSHGANVNEKDYNGETALFIATVGNRKEIVELLLLHGANVNEKDKDGRTALYVATCMRYRETAEILISHGANINEI